MNLQLSISVIDPVIFVGCFFKFIKHCWTVLFHVPIVIAEMGLRKRRRDNSSLESNSLDSEVLKRETHIIIQKPNQKNIRNMIIINIWVMIHQCQGHHQGDHSPRGQTSVIMMIIMKKSHGKKIVTIIIPVLYQKNTGVTMTVFNLQITTRSPRTLCRAVFLFFVYFKCCSDFLLYFYKCSTSMVFT